MLVEKYCQHPKPLRLDLDYTMTSERQKQEDSRSNLNHRHQQVSQNSFGRYLVHLPLTEPGLSVLPLWVCRESIFNKDL